MSTALSFTTGPGPDGAVVLAATGEIDMSNAAVFAEALTAAHEDAAGPVIVDLTRVEYLDSAGLAMLVRISSKLSAARTPMTVIAPLDSVARRAIALSGLARPS